MAKAAKHPRENVWDYPRPPRLERVPWRVRVEHRSVVLADAEEVHRVLETTHPPVYYIGRRCLAPDCLRPSRRRATWCEWKGQAEYLDVVAGR